MGRKFLMILFFSMSVFVLYAQKANLYDTSANAEADIKKAVAEARAQGKYVLIQAGGNWCSWCLEFNRVITTNSKIDSVIKTGYVLYHLNYSKENHNDKAFKKLGFPQRFGYPVFIILDGRGKVIHTQNSEYLEDGRKSYNVNKVQSFLEMWSPHARDPKSYGM